MFHNHQEGIAMISQIRGIAISCLWFVAAFIASSAAQAQQWQQASGAAKDVGVGANGAVWVVGTNAAPGGYRVWRREGGDWRATAAAGLRIAVGPNGEAWVVDDTQNIYRVNPDGANFTQVDGKAHDIGVGANGTIWVIGTNPEAGGYAIYRSTNDGASWTKIPGSALRISVDASGNAWVINNANAIFRYTGSEFASIAGSGTDVGIGPDGAVWVIGTDDGIYRRENDTWVKKPGGAAQVAAGPNGLVWVVNAVGAIYHAVVPYQAPVVVQVNPGVMAVPQQPQQPSPQVVVQNPMGPVITSTTPAPAAAVDPANPWRVFPRGGQYEARILKAIRFQRFASEIFPGGQAPAASTLSPLERAFGDIALSATEAYFAASPLAPDHAITRVETTAEARRSVLTFMSLAVIAHMSGKRRDAEMLALRQWATEVFRNVKILTAKAMLEEYRRWTNDPCGYEGLPPIRCQGMSGMLSPPRPSQDLMAKAAIGNVMASSADEVAVMAVTGLTAAATSASAAALASVLGGAGWTSTLASVSTPMVSLYSAFGGSSGAAAAGGGVVGSLGAIGWAGVAAPPIAAVILTVVVGTVEGVAVVDGIRVEPIMKLKIGQAMTDAIVIENEIADQQGRDFFFLAFATAAAKNFFVPANTVDGEVRFYCQAGFACRFRLSYGHDGVSKSFQTESLSVGREQSYAIPYNAINIAIFAEGYDGSNWKIVGSKTLPKPTYLGYTAYGTVFEMKVRDGYPETANIIAPANQLIVTHGGGYVASIHVSYTQHGATSYALKRDDLTSPWQQTFEIPRDASNIHVQAWSSTGLAWEPWKSIIDQTWPSPPSVCVRIYGTTLEPKASSECQSP